MGYLRYYSGNILSSRISRKTHSLPCETYGNDMTMSCQTCARAVHELVLGCSVQVGKGVAFATPSPLSRWGRFPIFTGVPFSGTGRPRGNCPRRGTRHAPDSREGISNPSDSRPKRFRCFKRNRQLSSTDLRLNFMHRRRMRSQRSRLRYALPQSDHRVAK